jgi:hypothetical protein
MLITWWMIGKEAEFQHVWIIADSGTTGNQDVNGK